MGEGYTDPQGRFRPIRGGRKKGGAAVVAVGAAAAIAWGPAGLGGTGAGGAGGVSLSPSMHARVIDAKKALTRGKPGKAWRQLGLRQRTKRTARHLNCVAHSHGAVQAFFVASPCRRLNRLLLPLVDARGNAVMLSVAWVRMPTTRDATRLKLLVDVHGTGDVEPLGVQELRRQGITFTAHHYDSDQEGALLTIAEAEPLRGHPSGDLLEAVAQVGTALPRPRARG